ARPRWPDPPGTGFHGHVFMGANVPFGAVQLGPANLSEGWDWCSGYHISDNNIVRIINSIASCLTQDNIIKLRNHLIFVKRAHQDTEIGAETTLHHVDGFNIPVTTIKTKSFLPIYEVLAQNERRIPAKFLRQLKAQVSELVLTQDPNNRLRVLDIEDDRADEVDVVFGIGVANDIADFGYASIKRVHLFKNLILDDSLSISASGVLSHTLPNSSCSRAYAPIFKYLAEAELLREDGSVIVDALHQKVIDSLAKNQESFQTKSYSNKRTEIERDYCTLTDLIERLEPEKAFLYIPFLPVDRIDTQVLLERVLHSFLYVFYPKPA
ncbi:MAG: hypothetical protein EOO88_59405, partial [Pedobacter sp.]